MSRRRFISKPRTLVRPETLERRDLMAGDFRTIDGTGNNAAHPEWGTTGSQLLRYLSAQYSDGFNSPAGADRASPRVISNAVAAQNESIPSANRLTSFVFQWGQFIDHDMDLSNAAAPAESFPISIPTGDPFFDPTGTGTKVMPLNRSEFRAGTGNVPGNPREQTNALTSFLDASMVYGSTAERAASLRTFSGGRLKTSDGNLLPLDSNSSFIAGDIRVTEQVALTSIQTLFMREHNRLADQFAAANPGWNDELIYQNARRIVGAEIQAITYREFLPAVLGANAMPSYTGYNPQVNPGIANEFSTAAFRVGHTMLAPEILRLDANGQVIPAGNLSLRNAFFNTAAVKNDGIDPILRGLAVQLQQEIDIHVVDDVRNFLFGPPGAGGLDLPSLNIQRGRDHGLGSLNQTRVALGLPAYTSFAQISSSAEVQSKLASVYANVNDIDLWVGGLAEDHLPGGNLGSTFARIWVDQFTRLRDGDSFYYERSLNPGEVAFVNSMTLAEVVKANTSITNIQGNAFQIALTAQFQLADNSVQSATLPAGAKVGLQAAQGEWQLVDLGTKQIYLRANASLLRSVTLDGRNGGQDLLIVNAAPGTPLPAINLKGGKGEFDELFIKGTETRDVLRLDADQGNLNNAALNVAGVEHVRFEGFGGDDIATVSGKQSRQIDLFGGLGKDQFAPIATNAVFFVADEAGIDLLDFRDATSAIDFSLLLNAGQPQQLPGNSTLFLFDNFERLIGTTGNDRLGGNNVENTIWGLAGDDEIHGFDRRDKLIGGAGNDLLFGEDGHDDLRGGDGNDILSGGRGLDALYGQNGTDILIGGLDSDVLVGNDQDDLVISGDSTYSANVEALLRLMQEWSRPISNVDRIKHLQDGGGLNGQFLLRERETLVDDGVADLILSERADRDWLLFDSLDTVRHR